MNNYKLIEVICNKYNRADVKRYQKSVLFLIRNTISGEMSLFQIDRVHKHAFVPCRFKFLHPIN